MAETYNLYELASHPLASEQLKDAIADFCQSAGAPETETFGGTQPTGRN